MRTTITGAHNIAKYPVKKKERSDLVNRLILDTLLGIYQLGINARSDEKKQVALTANGIRMAFFDDMKQMSDVIPEVLLPGSYQRNKEIKPSDVKPGLQKRR